VVILHIKRVFENRDSLNRFGYDPMSGYRAVAKNEEPKPQINTAENPESQQETKRDRLATLSVISGVNKRSIFTPKIIRRDSA